MWCEFLEAAFFTHDSLVNGHSLKSLSLLLINQPSLLATKSHDHFTETWQTMYVGEQKLLKKLNLSFCATVDVAAGCWWYITWYPGSCKWSHVQTKGFIQHISITYSMKNKPKTDSNCIICPRQIYPPMFICISNINISEVSSGRKCVYLSVCFLLPMGLLSCYTLWMKGRVYSIIILKKCVFFSISWDLLFSFFVC